MKPILFNVDMVRAILEDRKTVTRRVVKPQPIVIQGRRIELQTGIDFDWLWNEGAEEEYIKVPYRPGEILYVRETFFEYKGRFYYKADGKHDALDLLIGSSFFKWRPSIHMPREAARIFLRVTAVRVERLHYITRDEAVREGANPALAVDDFKRIWDSTVKKSDLARYGWDANPWAWVIEFERVSKEEAV